MPSATPVRRVGPLTAIEGDEPALALGDVAVHHVRLTPTGLTPHLGDAPSGFVPWSAVRAIEVDTPTTWWPSPALGDTVVPLVEGLFGGSSDLTETPSFAVHLTDADSGQLEWRATPHFVSGYRRKDAVLTARLVELLVTRPDSRILLAQPAELLTRLTTIVSDPPPAS